MTQLEMATVLETRAQPQGDDLKAGNAYLASVPRSERRASGTYYTPPHLVEFVLNLAGYVGGQDLEHTRMLDPACGGGAFLIGAALRLADRLRTLGVRLHTARGANRFLKTCERNLFGIDLDPEACELARGAVRTAAAKLVAPRPVAADFFSRNVIDGDCLLGSEVEKQRPRAGFGLIVGNPPYVPTTRLSTEVKDSYRARFQTANGRIDLYVLFFERCLELLADSGRLAFITPNKFLTSVSAAPLRTLLRQKSSVRTIAEFDSHKVFEGAATVPCITVIDRKKSNQSTTYIECVASEDAVEIRHESRHALPGNEWLLRAPDVLNLLARLKASHPSLSTHVTRISAGIATGCDRVFVMATEEADRLGIEHELRHPVARGRDIHTKGVLPSNLEVIIPYALSAKGTFNLVDIAKYPSTHEYLSKHRPELEQRHCVRTWGKQWYDLHDPWNVNITETPKIVVPDIALSNRFAADQGNFCPLHSAYYLVPKNPDEIDFLTAVLNSEIAEFCVRASAPIVKDGFVRYRKQFLQPLPIPNCDADVRRSLLQKSGSPKLFNHAIAKLFGISDAELERIQSGLGRTLR